MSAIQLENINFAYSKNEFVLRDLNLMVEQGSIYGFLGANGAGKTTTLRLVLRLLRSNSGKISILGEDISISHPKYLKSIGALIENASLYDHLSAFRNLKIWAKYYNVAQSRCHEVLEIVGLENTLKKKVADFSTGMRQRLGLGIALLNDPEILILDEPTNGLDPMGIQDLRSLLFKLRDQGKTILLSSHILSEVERIVDHIGILKGGQLVFQGQLNQLQNLLQSNIPVHIRVSDNEKALALIEESLQPTIHDGELFIIAPEQKDLPPLIKRLVESDIAIYEVSPQKKNLENLFLELAN